MTMMNDADATCKYTYKPCMNPRSTKRNGKPHLLCEFHRAKANAIQKAYATKKRLHKQAQQTQATSPTASDEFWASMNLDDHQWSLPMDLTNLDDDDVPLTAEDCAMIANLFFQEHTVVEL
ncbi:hypothetical protein SPRG_15442 [Saprolegnia parasitica CBS 223.65]|uniref:Uncharacterized protein n=1 Tax=Saprolegnia parasitica (strain CBS 223.65) TaxID=695850 RepID=A0A067BWI7_SAPPC|nr:hypothetical protein SPRG_15442 [Saprolegnia parasitica CBS 223.65]KDO18646.1 hypothetical protein SPRG_15442 [Saprolegnia parasitica CBS 223.65]|eukprot:XP_012210651.1 hypothetical protein SPRG_15442 [Saprolegnia parasitica CBS 223.65]